jgi:phenylalanyl-tRNA synthetase alpha chain
MLENIKKQIAEVESFNGKTKEEVEQFRIKYLGKKGLLNDFFAEFKNVANDQKKEFGQAVNKLKTTAEGKVNSLKDVLSNAEDSQGMYGDLSRPGDPLSLGSRHPISIVKNRIIEIFSRIGFNVSEGPEIEDDWHNFTALNLPAHHPARDMQDTWRIINRQFEPFHLDGFTATRLFLLVLIAFFIKLKAYTWTRELVLLI